MNRSKIMRRAMRGKPVIIAEIGVNYYDIAEQKNISPIEAAKLMIEEAYKNGADAVKFQTYKADNLAAKNSPSYWDTSEEQTTSQHQLFKKFDKFSYNEYKVLSDYCTDLGIEFLSTPFDFESADYLAELMNVYKISSSDLNNIPFIEYQAKKNKPILLSTGASTYNEIHSAIDTITENNSQPIILLHCVLEYPTPNNHANLNRIISLKNRFPQLIIGYSDHTRPDKNADIIKTAYNLGAIVIEKHFTLDKSLPGNDHYHAMDAMDLKNIVNNLKFVEKIRGKFEIDYSETETVSRQNARRSIVTKKALTKGEIITEDKITYKRPGTGISPDKIEEIIGRQIKSDIEEDTILTYEMVETKK